ncbi:MAG: HAMP domain-containing sensor histidine kinase [Bacteroidota bacterium]
MLKLFKYKTPSSYSSEFKEVYSKINVRQIKLLSTALFVLASSIRLLAHFYHEEVIKIPNIAEYNLNNLFQIVGSSAFLIISSSVIKFNALNRSQRNILTLLFAIFVLSTSFFLSYIYSLHNVKNTLTVFLIGVVLVSMYFSLEFKYIITLSIFIILLFAVGMIVPNLTPAQQLFNFVASIVLAFVLYLCSRYSYYFKSQHFVQLKQLEEKNLEVQELNRQRGEILGFVAHDLRNPLNNIEALSRIMIEEDEKSENVEAKLILSSSRQAKDIINDLVEVIQVEKVKYELLNTDLVDYINEICLLWQANAGEQRKINFITEEQQVILPVNPSKFYRVIDNLIGNGIKFSDNSTPIDVQLTKSENNCQIKVKDYGIGIPEHLKSMLFDQFSKAGRAGLKGEKSIGLGLHISKDIVEQHGGTLTIETEENKGSTFIISLPIAS